MISYNPTVKLLTVAEVAEMLHVHPNTLRRWADEGRIANLRITHRGDRRFKLSDVENFLLEMNPYKYPEAQNNRHNLELGGNS